MTDIDAKFQKVQELVDKFEKDAMTHASKILEYVNHRVVDAAKEEFAILKRVLQAAIRAVTLAQSISAESLRADLEKLKADDKALEALLRALVRHPDDEQIEQNVREKLADLGVDLKTEEAHAAN